MKRVCIFFLVTALLVTSLVAPTTNVSAVAISASDYPVALKDAILFYDANKCGKDVAADNVFNWRSACHTTDGSNVGKDLEGGYHDAGDHIKFGITQGYAASILGWSLYEFRDSHDASGTTTKLLSTLKYFTDFFIKSRVSATKYAYHVGDTSDHDYWGPPELQTGSRTNVFYMGDGGDAAADVCGLYSGALTLMYLNYKSIDEAYANKCLEISKELYALGKKRGGCGNAIGFYTSSAWQDDMAWAAIWLYVVEKNNSYLTDVQTFLPNAGTNWTVCWNDMKLAVACVVAAVTGNEKYKNDVSSNISYWISSVPTSNGGLKFLVDWGTMRYTAAESMLALVYYKYFKDEKCKTFAKSQIDYILGANPANMSYIIGFGNKYPKNPHHRAASGQIGWDNWKAPAKNLLIGALVGGPDKSDNYIDLTEEYKWSEVAIDYNAGLVGALAGMNKYYGSVPSNTPVPTYTSKPTNTPVPSIIPQDGKIAGYVKPDFSSSNSSIKSGFTATVVSSNGSVMSTQKSDSNGYFLCTVHVSNVTECTLKITKEGYLAREFTGIKSNKRFGSAEAPVVMWAGDMDQNGAINIADVFDVVQSFNSSAGSSKYQEARDLNKDGAVNIADIQILASHFNKSSADYPVPEIFNDL
jgi:hypothetical protein